MLVPEHAYLLFASPYPFYATNNVGSGNLELHTDIKLLSTFVIKGAEKDINFRKIVEQITSGFHLENMFGQLCLTPMGE